MLIRSCIAVLTIVSGLSVASGASAVEVTNGLSVNGLSVNDLSVNGTATSAARLEAAILQDGSVIVLAQ
jgi:hypothetical protein